MKEFILKLISRWFVGKVGYALDTYIYTEDGKSTHYYRIERVFISDVYISVDGSIDYSVNTYPTGEAWGDIVEDVFLSKRAAERRISKLCKV